jgi:hypothetical protein
MTAGLSTAHGLRTIKLPRGRQKMRLARTSTRVAAYYVVAEALTNATTRKDPRRTCVRRSGEPTSGTRAPGITAHNQLGEVGTPRRPAIRIER